MQDALEQKTSEALTTETKKELSRNRGKVKCTADSFQRHYAVSGLCSRVTYQYTVSDFLPLFETFMAHDVAVVVLWPITRTVEEGNDVCVGQGV